MREMQVRCASDPRLWRAGEHGREIHVSGAELRVELQAAIKLGTADHGERCRLRRR